MNRKKIVIVVALVLVIMLLSVAIFWLYKNTSIFTNNVPSKDLQNNNLNSQNADYELTPVSLQGKTINIPKGFKISIFANDIKSARFMSFSPTTTLFIGTKDNDKIYAVKDTNNDSVGDYVNVIDSGLNTPHSVYYHNGNLYLGEENRVTVYKGITDDGKYSEKQVIIDNLPAGNRLTGGGHKTRTVVVGPDDKLYVSIGSTCNVCIEDDERRATIMQYNLDGSNGKIFASGLRNTVGFDFDDQDRLWGADMGRDEIGDDIPPEEVNIIEQGNNYGWPYCYGDKIANPEYPERVDYCKNNTQKPYINMQAHSAPLGFTFLNDAAQNSWPNTYKSGFLVAFHGSWNRTIPTGYKVVWIDTSGAEPKQYNFLSGWLEANADAWGRPVGLAFDNSGSLYISDDKQSLIYKLSLEN